jgi:sugar O-acyltransferase (sialic acid O-acetyltransferase NeuD family)
MAAKKTLQDMVIVGASGHGKVVMDVIEKQGLYRIIGLVDDGIPAGQVIYGYPLLGTVADLPAICARSRACRGFVSIGDNWVRQKVVLRIAALLPDFNHVTAVHPSAQVGRGASIGCGTVLMAGAVVNSDSRVGRFCIINSNASLDHDCALEDYASLAPGVITGGNVSIGTFSAAGLGANILEGRKIGAHTVIGAAALVNRDLPDHCVAYGSPARVVRSRVEGEKYLSTIPKSSR